MFWHSLLIHLNPEQDSEWIKSSQKGLRDMTRMK